MIGFWVVRVSCLGRMQADMLLRKRGWVLGAVWKEVTLLFRLIASAE